MEQKSFADIFEDVTKQAVKIQKKDYLPTGRYPIIDQGQEWCAGYTDREDGLFQDVPAYIFGDHTRIIKYTDEPFYLGADGVKLLKLREGIQANPRFFYYALKSQRIPDTGYNRHFKWLKESLYHVPTLNEQTHIADTLDTLSTLITLCKTKIFLFDELVKSQFVEMFGEPYSNSLNLPAFKLGDLCDVTKLAGFEYTNYIHYQESGDVIMIKALNVKNKRLKLDNISYIDATVSDALPRSQLHKGDVVMTYIGVNIGDVALVDAVHRYHLAPNVAKISVKDVRQLLPEFLVNQIYYNKDKFTHAAGNTAKAALNMEKLRKIDILLPDSIQQKIFVDFARQVDKSKLVLRQLLEKQRTLKAALMQEYFAAK